MIRGKVFVGLCIVILTSIGVYSGHLLNKEEEKYQRLLKLNSLQLKTLNKSLELHSKSLVFARQVSEECDLVDEMFDCFREDYNLLEDEVREVFKRSERV